MMAGVTTRLKVLAKLDIAERAETAGRPLSR
jgi:type II secretory ATPase GspE/PulE/Tfp pilus assembly ATPase PilB-like protein